MLTWICLLSAALILYAHRVEGDFGEKVDSNETTAASPSSTEGDITPEMMMIIVPYDRVEVQKAALTAMITQEDDEELPSSAPFETTTETSSISPGISFEEDNMKEINFQDTTRDRKSSLTPASGLNQIASNRFADLQEKPIESTHFESIKLKPAEYKQENGRLKQQELSKDKYINSDYQKWNPVSLKQGNHEKEETQLETQQIPENKYINNDYIPSWDYLSLNPAYHKKEKSLLELEIEFLENKFKNTDYLQPWNNMPLKPYPTQPTQAFDYSLNKNTNIHGHERIEQNLQYQIEAAKAYINQIKLEQEYALRSKGQQESYSRNFKYTQPSPANELNFRGSVPSYLSQLSQPTILPYTLSPTLTNLGVQPTPSSPRVPFTVRHDGHSFNPGSRDWNRSSNNDPYVKVSGFGNNHWNYLNNQWQGNQDKSQSSFNQLNKNQWNSSSQKLHNPPNLPGVQSPSSYPGPTASPVVLPSGYLDETEEVKQARDIHLRAIVKGTQAASHWIREQPNKSWR